MNCSGTGTAVSIGVNKLIIAGKPIRVDRGYQLHDLCKLAVEEQLLPRGSFGSAFVAAMELQCSVRFRPSVTTTTSCCNIVALPSNVLGIFLGIISEEWANSMHASGSTSGPIVTVLILYTMLGRCPKDFTDRD